MNNANKNSVKPKAKWFKREAANLKATNNATPINMDGASGGAGSVKHEAGWFKGEAAN